MVYRHVNFLWVLVLVFSLLFLVSTTVSFPIEETSLGTINGTSVIAITHGNSERLKELIPLKNSENDDFNMFGGMALGVRKLGMDQDD
ncbi:hypothetical protein GCK72_022240 [Caenorhabditis remanei]|uniref:Uncharacterized protein n=1 Tax=Caenorhabditis remanei TaxID=31234 RepID=E3MA32_CAERE|nr:hypothetical protein GCK72_022240 [Caenorhabditis remanei]EFO96826.1 hypothetical protein CRE_17090 [Caenorhabditis remanei]KAF1745793.1 hypothetical protein GCK72_022240 [Caenorhabditis remanei]